MGTTWQLELRSNFGNATWHQTEVEQCIKQDDMDDISKNPIPFSESFFDSFVWINLSPLDHIWVRGSSEQDLCG